MKQFDIDSKVLIVGLGLLGGSYAKSLKKKGIYVSAIDTRTDAIAYAINNGIIDEGYDYVNKEAVANADTIVFALYPKVFVQWIEDYQQYFSPGVMLTDVTGVKSCIVYKIQQMLRPDVEFISAHTMAGREVYGVENSDDGIFHGANYIVVPTPANSKDAIDNCRKLGIYLGFAGISTLSPEEHDEMIGFVSQLTHCIAVTLMTCNTSEGLEKYTGDSFRDLTRIAKINDAMWSELFLMNKDALLAQMDAFSKEFERLRSMIAGGDRDSMRDMMRRSTQRRSLFDKPKA